MVMPVWRRPKAVALGNLELPTKSVSHGPSLYQLIEARGAPLAHTKYLNAFLCHRANAKGWSYASYMRLDPEAYTVLLLLLL